MSNALAITLIGVGIFVVYLEQTGKLSSVIDSAKSATGKGGEVVPTGTMGSGTEGYINRAWGGRTFVTPLGVLNVTDAGTI